MSRRQGGAYIDRPEVHQSDLKALQACITVLDGGIRVAEAAHPDAPLFANVAGAGAALRPRLIVAFGTQRDRYACCRSRKNA